MKRRKQHEKIIRLRNYYINRSCYQLNSYPDLHDPDSHTEYAMYNCMEWRTVRLQIAYGNITAGRIPLFPILKVKEMATQITAQNTH